MRNSFSNFIKLAICICLFAGCHRNSGKGGDSGKTSDTINVSDTVSNADVNEIPEDAVKGDFNGDGALEYMWLLKPEIDEEGVDCKGDCDCYIKFSDAGIPQIKVKNCIGGRPANLGDLNDNGTDDIGLLPQWFTSCWSDYFVWTFSNNQWIYAVDPFPTHCNQWDNKVKPIEKDLTKKGNVFIRYSELSDNDSIVVRSKSIRIAK